MERVCLFIDGSNFYHLVLKKIGVLPPNFNFDDFVSFLANGREITPLGKRYYTGTVREKENDAYSKEQMSLQTKLFGKLISTGWQLKTSKLRTRIEEVVIDERTVGYEKLKKAGIEKVMKKAGMDKLRLERKREKGIDVKIATDLIGGAVDDKYDIAILISSDADLIPAIDWVQHRAKKKIEYIGFSIVDTKDSTKPTKPLLSMVSRADISRTLVESDVKKFIQTK